MKTAPPRSVAGPRYRVLKIALIGFGALGRQVAEGLGNPGSRGILCAVVVRPEQVVRAGAALPHSMAVYSDPEELAPENVDLVVEWKDERHVIEMKLRRDTETESEGIEQLCGYLDGLSLNEGWLILFDLRSTQPWPERLYRRTVDAFGKRIHLVGC